MIAFCVMIIRIIVITLIYIVKYYKQENLLQIVVLVCFSFSCVMLLLPLRKVLPIYF